MVGREFIKTTEHSQDPPIYRKACGVSAYPIILGHRQLFRNFRQLKTLNFGLCLYFQMLLLMTADGMKSSSPSPIIKVMLL